MADAKPDTESLLEFVTRHYKDLKTKAETDNNTPPNDKIAAVIIVINELYETIKKGDAIHEKIVEQLNALRTPYNALGLTDPYTRYIEANDSLNMIVDGFNEVDAGEGEGEGEKGSGAGETGEGEGVDAGE